MLGKTNFKVILYKFIKIFSGLFKSIFLYFGIFTICFFTILRGIDLPYSGIDYYGVLESDTKIIFDHVIDEVSMLEDGIYKFEYGTNIIKKSYYIVGNDISVEYKPVAVNFEYYMGLIGQVEKTPKKIEITYYIDSEKRSTWGMTYSKPFD